MKLTDMFFIATDAPRCKRTGHRIADCFLYGGKGRVCCIWHTKGVQFIFFNPLDYLQYVILRNNDIRIKNNKEITLCSFKTIVPGKALTFIFLKEILYIQLVFELIYNMFCFIFRPILHYDDLEFLIGLVQQRTEHFLDLNWPVIDRNDNGKKHIR